MKISGGLREKGVVVGNVYNKYRAGNPFVRFIMRSFDESLSTLVEKVSPLSIHEVGCGEGYWVLRWHCSGYSVRGTDFSSSVIDLAKANARARGINPDLFEALDLYKVEPLRDSADLVICLEVLEHLNQPEDGLRALQRIVKNYVILSVPREPVWRMLNLLRGRYIKNLGNTPGHVNHWSQRRFVELVSRYFDIVEMKAPLPWTVILCRNRN